MFNLVSKCMLALLVLSLAFAFPVRAQAAPTDQTIRVSMASDGTEANSGSQSAVVSANGRFVAFESSANDLAPADQNNVSDIFLRDTQTNTTRRISVASDGSEANGPSYEAGISADGRYVAFSSDATNLVNGDTNNTTDIFVRDVQANATTRVSLSWDGLQANNYSMSPAISGNGQAVAFVSAATNLVSGDTNNASDVFVRDLQNSTTTRVSVGKNGLFVIQSNGDSYSPAISNDGSMVTYYSTASNLVDGDVNPKPDVFITMVQFSLTDLVSVDSNEAQANDGSYFPSITADGRYVAFQSFASNLVTGDNNNDYDIFVRDTLNGTTALVSVSSTGSQGNVGSLLAAISPDGRYVAFTSVSDNLVSGDTNAKVDVFVHDLQTRFTSRASVASDGAQGNGNSSTPSISLNGRKVAFESAASNLVGGDGNNVYDIFSRAMPQMSFLRSRAADDGWVLESGENSNAGGTLNNAATTFNLGDDAANKQYRAILSFDTSSLPDTAVILNVALMIRKQGLVGSDPFSSLGPLHVDVRTGSFGGIPLQVTDFQAAASKNVVGAIPKAPVGGWNQKVWTGSVFSFINKTGVTQFRLHFKLDDNNNGMADYIKFYSGNASESYRPQLIVEFYVP